MNNQVNFYAIRIVGTDYFMIDKHRTFGTFEEAMQLGTFFNTEKSALKRIREEMKALKGQDGYPLVSSQYQMRVDGEWKLFTALQECADAFEDYKIIVRDIELEIVPLVMSIA